MDALELLKQDHQKVKQLFEQCQIAKDKKQQKQIFKEIKTELETHTRLEETIFYPAIEEYEELKDMVLESLEEHKQVKTVLREMSRRSPSSERFKPKFKVLKDDVEHHAEEEEEGKMFPKIRRLIDSAELERGWANKSSKPNTNECARRANGADGLTFERAQYSHKYSKGSALWPDTVKKRSKKSSGQCTNAKEAR
jgi:hemerythrin superfamily protein